MFILSLSRSLAGALLLSGAATTQAATLLVTVKNDSYDGQCNLNCSLRDAVQVANQSADADIILLPSGTYKLTRPNLRNDDNQPIDEDDNLIGDLDVTGELLIKGGGIGKSIIEGLTEDLFAVEHRLIEVHPGASLSLDRMTLTDGRSAQNGGAVENHGSLLLRNVHVLRNITRTVALAGDPSLSGRGGAIANYGTLRVLASRLEYNSALGEYPFNLAMGGALFNSGSLLVRDSHLSGNDAGSFSLTGAGGALFNSGRATLESSSFTTNGNYAEGGTLTNQGGVLTVINSTLSNNIEGALTNGRDDAALGSRSRARLTNVTITDNTGEIPNIYAVMNWGELSIRNSLIAGNQDYYSDEAQNCRNFGDHYSYQAIGLLRNDEQSNCSADLFVPYAQTFTQVLSPTLTSDGKTSFHALLPGSPAIDAGIGDCIAKDQRGVTRPKDGNGDGVAVCDLGAYELIP